MAVATQPDGRIVAAGYVWGDEESFALARYKADGSLDPSFGSGGRAITSFDGDCSAWAIAIQPDGKIVAVGVCWKQAPYRSYFALTRYRSDGSLDLGFGSDGRVLTAIGQYARAYAVALEPDGKIVVGGTGNNGIALARYQQDGLLDMNFGEGGTVTTAGRSAQSLALTPEGEIIAAGTAYDVIHGFAVTRYTPDGSLDPSFGSNGTVTTTLQGCYASGEALALQPDGRIVLVGTISSCSRWETALARYEPDGSLDESFGTGGKVFTALGEGSFGNAVALQPDGKIVVAGGALDGAIWTFGLVRYESDGSLDSTFGRGGGVLIGLGARGVFRTGEAYAVSIEPDGKIVAAGRIDQIYPEGPGFALARYLVTPGCVVPDVVGAWLAEARDAIAPSGCSLTIARAYSRKVPKGFVILQRPAPETQLPEGSPVKLVVSKGKRKRR